MKIKRKEFRVKRDNLLIKGYEYKGNNNGKVAILSHAFMMNQRMVSKYAKHLAKKGYIAFTFDFCGGGLFSKSEGKKEDMSILTEVKDLIKVIEYVLSLSYVNKDDLLLLGCSQGGLVSSLVASILKDKIKKLVLFYPAFSIPFDARKGEMLFTKFDINNLKDVFYSGPMKLGKRYVLDAININPYEEITSYKNDVLIVHGNKDKIVNINYSKEAYLKYKENDNRVTIFKEINGAGHIFSKKYDKASLKYLDEFID